jgi:hypothetical protein
MSHEIDLYYIRTTLDISCYMLIVHQVQGEMLLCLLGQNIIATKIFDSLKDLKSLLHWHTQNTH